ncbi:MAG: hypothetical protein ACE5EE_03375 [Fidelibacterota bacterium]
MIYKFFVFVMVHLGFLTTIAAQPNFPSSPNQAPIGGLGLLAVLGGSLAIKKLIDRQRK